MKPIAFHIGSWPIYWYGIFAALGFLAAIIHWAVLSRRRGLPPGFASDLGFWIMLSGVLGARIAFVLANGSYYAKNPLMIFRIDQGGLIFFGGFIGAVIAVVVLARIKHQPVLELGDFTVSGLPLGHALGRVGCLLKGCCFGIPCDLPWSIHLEGAPRHPAQIYEALFNLGLYGFFLWYYPKRKRRGELFTFYLMAYPAFRFLVEFLRGDDRLYLGTLTLAQYICAVLFVVGLVWWLWLPKITTESGDGRKA